jgi:hypothetical protein
LVLLWLTPACFEEKPEDTSSVACEPVPEVPYDGIDQDCDGADLTDVDEDGADALEAEGGTDCDDANSLVYLNAAERYDGFDNDCDGLVDCEDSDCLPVTECEERVCDDGLDSDHDGLVDCEDDDCWSLDCHPGGVRSRVHGGNMHQQASAWRWDYTGWGAAVPWFFTDFAYTQVARLHSVWGTLQVLPPGATSWDGTSARTTCSWSVATASMTWTLRWGSGVYPLHLPVAYRAGVAIDEGCRVAGSSFLPAEVHPAQGIGWADNSWHLSGRWRSGLPWYQGSITANSYQRTDHSGYGGTTRWGHRSTSFSRSSTFQVDLQPKGATWHADP